MSGAIGVFLPGQGAQAVGMGRAFYDRFGESRELYQRANTRLGFDVTALCFEGPPEELTKTERCQLALFVTSLAAFAAFRRVAPNLRIVAAAGLSLGELTALGAAEAFTFADGLYLVQARAEAMAACAMAHPGTMLAVIGLTGEAIQEICRDADVTAANFNAADQVVLSGRVPGIETAERLAKEHGAKRVVRLDVAGAFHSPLMESASKVLARALEKISIVPPRFPVVSNVTARPMQSAEEVKSLLVKQIVSPVQWDGSVRWMVQQGARAFVEMPPARVLTGLLRRIDPSVKGVAVDDPKDFDKVTELTAAPA
jgi:[acyl-carrier-protein] S-malonyltransferase